LNEARRYVEQLEMAVIANRRDVLPPLSPVKKLPKSPIAQPSVSNIFQWLGEPFQKCGTFGGACAARQNRLQ
jgi:hypothetical protein